MSFPLVFITCISLLNRLIDTTERDTFVLNGKYIDQNTYHNAKNLVGRIENNLRSTGYYSGPIYSKLAEITFMLTSGFPHNLPDYREWKKLLLKDLLTTKWYIEKEIEFTTTKVPSPKDFVYADGHIKEYKSFDIVRKKGDRYTVSVG